MITDGAMTCPRCGNPIMHVEACLQDVTTWICMECADPDSRNVKAPPGYLKCPLCPVPKREEEFYKHANGDYFRKCKVHTDYSREYSARKRREADMVEARVTDDYPSA